LYIVYRCGRLDLCRAAIMGDMAMPDKNVKYFFADQPFLYAIVQGDIVLFLGRFLKPE